MILLFSNLKGWGNEPLVSMLKKHFSGPVYLENDANAAALAEWHYGYAGKVDSLLYLTFSTGMGGGMILNKKLWSGHSGGAGEVGFMTLVPQGRPGLNGVPGSFEAYTGGKNLAQHYGFKDFKTLCDDVHAGDGAAGDIFEEWLDFCALGIVNLIYVLDPQIIVLGTIAVRQPDLVLGPLRKKVQESLIPSFKNRTRIDISKIGETIGDYAALSVARNIR
jgi:glucokinase